MPDGQRSSSKGDKGLSGATDENFLYDACDENEGAAEELTAIVKQVSRFTFNNFIHSERFQAQLMMDGKDVDMKSSLKLGADLVVLSVVLNKKQKDNDEVALAIDRLRKNGVNCVFFTMNEMRNGTTKPTTAESEVLESVRRGAGKRPGVTTSLPPQPPQPTVNPEEKTQLDPSLIPKTFNSKERTSRRARKDSPPETPTNVTGQVQGLPESSGSKLSEELCAQPRKRNTEPPGPVSLVTMAKPTALPLQEGGESPAQHDHLLPPLLSPAEPEPQSSKHSKQPMRKRRRRRKYPYSKTGKTKSKKKGDDLGKFKNERRNGTLQDLPPVIEKWPNLDQNLKFDQILEMNGNGDSPPVLIRADLLEPVNPAPPKRRARKSKQEIIEEAVRASVAICGAPPEVVLRQPRKCTTKVLISVKEPKVVVRKEALAIQNQPKEGEDPVPALKVSIPLNQAKLPKQKISLNSCRVATSEACTVAPPQPKNAQSALRTPNVRSIGPPQLNSLIVRPANSPNAQVMSRKRTRPQSVEENPLTPLQLGPRRASSPDIVTRFARASKSRNRTKLLKQRSPSPDITCSSSGRSQSLTRSVQQAKISGQGPSVRTTQRSSSLHTALTTTILDLDLSPLECLEKETKSTLEKLLMAVVSSVDNEADPALQHVQLQGLESGTPLPVVESEVKVPAEDEVVDLKPDVALLNASLQTDDSLPDFPFPDSMQLRRSSFFSLITSNVRTNLEKYLDGRSPASTSKSTKRRRRVKNGFLLHHGDNCPEDPESPYKLHLATQVLLKLNKRRSKVGPKEDRGKTLLSYLKLVPRRPLRAGKSLPKVEEKASDEGAAEESVFSGEWTVDRKYVCGVCGAIETCFWDMVTHKGEEHPGVVVTHIELPANQEPPSSLIRKPPPLPKPTSTNPIPPPCTKCSATFSSMSDLHGHIFDCAGNSSWLEEKAVKKPKGRRRKRGFKRRFSNTPKKNKKADVQQTAKRRNSDPFKCEFCSREFKTEGWLRNHLTTHSLPVSIPLDKLPLASQPVRACLRKLKY